MRYKQGRPPPSSLVIVQDAWEFVGKSHFFLVLFQFLSLIASDNAEKNAFAWALMLTFFNRTYYVQDANSFFKDGGRRG